MGSNTDSDAFLETLLTAFGDISNCKVAVFGSGGAARACVHALLTKAANITVFTRDVARAERVFHDLDVAIAENTVARESEDLSGFDIVVNATPLGTKGEFERRTIATADKLSGVKLVYDLVYNPSKTRLMAEAEIAGVPHIGGLEMLIKQAARQFELWTERPAPVDVMAVAARERLQL
jgi:3-dehydroquinate dehydratase/shikimate dehydrogenase